MKASRNYKIGSQFPTTPDILTIKLSVSGANPDVNTADFKYNKDMAFACGFDDALIGHYTHMFPLFAGGVSGLDGQTYPGLKYDDGTGRMISFNATLVAPAGGIRLIENESNPASYSWGKLNQMVQAGFGINNHSLNHGGGPTPWNRLNEIKGAEQLFYDKIGYRPIIGTAPASEDGFLYSFETLGYIAHNSTYNEGNSSITIYGKMRPNQVPTSYVSLDRAYFGDSFSTQEIQSMKTYIDEIYNDCDGGGKMFGNMFTHGPGNTANFNSVYQYLLNHPKNTGNKRLWVPSVQEFFEYFHVKRNTVISQSLSGNVLTITLDQTNVNKNIRNRTMSLLTSGITINSLISITGGDDVTFNSSTGLVNVYKVDASKTINPSADVLPAQIISITASGASVLIKYDKPVSQTMMAGYSIAGKTVTGISGNGTDWTVTFNSNVNSGNTMTYKSHNGNAITVGGIKVCDYINYPIS